MGNVCNIKGASNKSWKRKVIQLWHRVGQFSPQKGRVMASPLRETKISRPTKEESTYIWRHLLRTIISIRWRIKGSVANWSEMLLNTIEYSDHSGEMIGSIIDWNCISYPHIPHFLFHAQLSFWLTHVYDRHCSEFPLFQFNKNNIICVVLQ